MKRNSFWDSACMRVTTFNFQRKPIELVWIVITHNTITTPPPYKELVVRTPSQISLELMVTLTPATRKEAFPTKLDNHTNVSPMMQELYPWQTPDSLKVVDLNFSSMLRTMIFLIGSTGGLQVPILCLERLRKTTILLYKFRGFRLVTIIPSSPFKWFLSVLLNHWLYSTVTDLSNLRMVSSIKVCFLFCTVK